MMLRVYRLLMPLGFVLFVPGLLWKLWRRPGYKKTYAERFGRFSPERRAEFAEADGRGVWIHAVSVGETVLALSLIAAWRKIEPARRFVISTTTTTGQELARKKAPENVSVIFSPVDFRGAVRAAFDLVRPAALVILETELWPNMIAEAKKRRVPLALVNARLSDHSFRGYRRFKGFFAPLLGAFDVIACQSAGDAGRFAAISGRDNVVHTGNLKFDQCVPTDLTPVDLNGCFGTAPRRVLLGASTHPREEELLTEAFIALRKQFPELKLVLVPRHAERGGEIAAMLQKHGLSYIRRSLHAPDPADPVDVLLADTTGEMLRFMAGADLVFMGKSLAGHDEGHNLIEPALLAKPIVCGPELKNFRFVFDVLKNGRGVAVAENDAALAGVCARLLADDAGLKALGDRAAAALAPHAGAARRSVELVCALPGFGHL